MSTDPSVHIARISRRMAWLTTGMFWLWVPALAVFMVIIRDMGSFPGLMIGVAPRVLPPLVAVAAWGVLTLVSLPALWGLWALKRLFEGYAAGAIFTVAAARRLRHCGYALVAGGIEGPFASALLSVALTFDLPKGSRMLVVSFSSNDIVLLVVGALLLTVARVMGEAARIAEENAGFV
jgi:hypothetical protein